MAPLDYFEMTFDIKCTLTTHTLMCSVYEGYYICSRVERHFLIDSAQYLWNNAPLICDFCH